MSSTDRYNDWANWATWNVTLWWGNDEDLYTTRCNAGTLTAGQAEHLVRECQPTGTPDMDSASELDDVNWQEIADAWNED